MQWATWWFLPACLALAAVLGAIQGQDANWDLRNYHYYNPHAWLTGRYGTDVAPAQVQTWLYPLADVPFYLMARAGTPSWLITAVLSIPAGVALFLLTRIACALSPLRAQAWTVLAVLVLAIWTATGYQTIGTVISEWHLVALLVGALWLLIGRSAEAVGRSAWVPLVAGALGGAAMGLKLTAAPYALGLAATALVLPGSGTVRWRRILHLGIGGVAAFLVVYGPWAWKLASELGNPFFPMMNDVFHSPYAQPAPYRDSSFAARSITAVLLLPFRMTQIGLVATELPMRDFRWLLAFPSLALLAFSPTSEPGERASWRGVAAFFVASYVAWAVSFGLYRYALVLQVLAAASIAFAVATILPRWAGWATLGLALFVAGATVRPGYERVAHGAPAVRAAVPPLPDSAMVVVVSGAPVAYVIPSFPPGVPVLSLVNNSSQHMLSGGRPLPLQIQALQRVKSHKGPLFLLTPRYATEPDARPDVPLGATLDQLGLAVDLAACRPIATGIDGENGLLLCPLSISR